MRVHHNEPISQLQLFLGFFFFVAASALMHQTKLDMRVEGLIYHLEGGNGGRFPLNHNYWLYDVIHQGGRYIVKRLFFITLGLAIVSHFVHRLKPHTSSFWFIVFATAISTAFISWLKHTSTIPCPKNLIAFGGSFHWVNIWQLFADNLPKAHCYPAGHASSGYAWLCLAFVFPYGSRAFLFALMPGTVLGMTFGIAQQIRGEHFISHDLLTIGICWLISGLVFLAIKQITGFRFWRRMQFYRSEDLPESR